MRAMTYEGFIRGAFSIKSNELIDRHEDLGGLANADIFNSSYNTYDLNKVKAGTAYAISAYNNEIFNSEISVENTDSTRMEELLGEALSATSSTDIIQIIDEYKTYRAKYFTHIWSR